MRKVSKQMMRWTIRIWLLFSHRVSLPPRGLQHIRLPCPSPSPGACSNSCPLSRWCHPTISSSVIPFSSCLQSFPASRFFPMSQLFASGGESIGVSASASVLPMNIQGWFPLRLTGWISLQSQGLSRVSSNTTVQKHQFFSTQNLGILSKKYMWWGFFIPRDFISVGLGWGQTNLFSLRLGWPQWLWEDLEESLAWETVELLHKMTLICQWDLFLPSWLQAKGPLSLFLLLPWMFFFKSIFEIDLGNLHLSVSAFLASQSYTESGGTLFSLLITLSSCPCFSIGTGCLCHLNFLQKKMDVYWASVIFQGLPRWLSGKESTCNAGYSSLIPRLGSSPGEGNGNPLQYSYLGTPTDKGAWRATVHVVAKSWTRLSDWAHTLSIRRYTHSLSRYLTAHLIGN